MKVEILADTIWPETGRNHAPVRITTFRLEFWRAILPQVLTHRMLSRSTSSSRALASEKLAAECVTPEFSREQRGMQGAMDLTLAEQDAAHGVWDWAFAQMQTAVDKLAAIGVHRQHRNRLLEPFSESRMVVTATEWDNFFHLRCAPDAQPEIRDLAEAMRETLARNTPEVSDLHIPYAGDVTLPATHRLEISAAACARVSYRNDSRTREYREAMRFARMLWKNGHKSPFEHQAVSLSWLRDRLEGSAQVSAIPQCFAYNLRGWASYRFCQDRDLMYPIFKAELPELLHNGGRDAW